MNKNINLIIAALVLSSCQGYSVTGGPGKTVAPSLMSQSDQVKDLVTVNSIYVAPVEFDASVRGADHAGADFNGRLQDAIREEVSLKAVFAGQTNKQNPSFSSYLQEAKSNNSDAILVTKINQFVERQGSAIGATQGALVNVTMQMFRVSDSKSIWQSSYHYKDQALTDNLFRIKNKEATWQNENELLKTAYSSALKDFSQKRLAQFSSYK